MDCQVAGVHARGLLGVDVGRKTHFLFLFLSYSLTKMSQQKLSKVTFHVDGIFTEGHARRCEAMIRNSGGGIENVKVNEISGVVEILYDTHQQTPHTIRDIVDETGYSVLE